MLTPYTLDNMNPGELRGTLTRLLTSRDAGDRLEALAQNGTLRHLSEDLHSMVGFGGGNQKDLWAHVKQVVRQADPRPELRWAALFHDVGKVCTHKMMGDKVTFHGHEEMSGKIWMGFCRRWRLFRGDFRDHVQFLITHLGRIEGYDREWTDSAVRRFAREVEPHLADLVALSWADITTKHDHKRQRIRNQLDDLVSRVRSIQEADARKHVLPKGLGFRLIRDLKVPEGPELGLTINRLKAAIDRGDLEPFQDADFYVEYVRSLGVLNTHGKTQ